jgi:hypothetical protein
VQQKKDRHAFHGPRGAGRNWYESGSQSYRKEIADSVRDGDVLFSDC